jgi:hypothetical protein
VSGFGNAHGRCQTGKATPYDCDLDAVACHALKNSSQ